MNQPTNSYVMLHDEKRCIGCQACTVACKVLNDIPEDLAVFRCRSKRLTLNLPRWNIFVLFASPASIVRMLPALRYAQPAPHSVMKTASCRSINRAVSAAITVLPRVRSTFVI